MLSSYSMIVENKLPVVENSIENTIVKCPMWEMLFSIESNAITHLVSTTEDMMGI